MRLNNRVQLYCADRDSGSQGIKIYDGFIYAYNPFIDGNREGINVLCLGHIAKLATDILKENE